ncbi:MAG: glycosyltransferase [Xanthomonadaceae bacterium]|nr:glycosyltransferase [Xanthomonadaceae bacterium]
MEPRCLLVRRDYRGYTGGHGKFRDYLAHADAHALWTARLYLTADSLCDAGNPFLDVPGLVRRWEPERADALLLGGMDWAALPAGVEARVPAINLVQGARHADAGSPLRAFLRRRAVRVCVSTAVAAAIEATGEVNGPVRVIPAAVDTRMLAALGRSAPRTDVFIDAVKQPQLGAAVAAALREAGLQPHLHGRRAPRADYLAAMAAATVVVTLPDPAEGFYLPGLEALAIGRALVQYDCGGSRDYLHDGANALVPPPQPPAIARAALQLHADAVLRGRLQAAGQATAQRFDLAAERAGVHALLDELDELWRR